VPQCPIAGDANCTVTRPPFYEMMLSHRPNIELFRPLPDGVQSPSPHHTTQRNRGPYHLCTSLTFRIRHIQFAANRAASSCKRNVMVSGVRPSVLSFFSNHNRARGAYSTCLITGQNATWPAYIFVRVPVILVMMTLFGYLSGQKILLCVSLPSDSPGGATDDCKL